MHIDSVAANNELERQYVEHKARKARMDRGLAPMPKHPPQEPPEEIPEAPVLSPLEIARLRPWPFVDVSEAYQRDEHVSNWRNNVGWKDIIRVISHVTEISIPSICGQRRTKDVVSARHIAMLLMVHDLGLTLNRAGRRLGNRDHTTVLHGVNKAKFRVENEPDFREQVARIRSLLVSKENKI